MNESVGVGEETVDARTATSRRSRRRRRSVVAGALVVAFGAVVVALANGDSAREGTLVPIPVAPGMVLPVTTVGFSPQRANTSPPIIEGDAAAGSRLSASTGSWIVPPTSFRYRWQRCDTTGTACVDIDGAVLVWYQPTAADIGGTIRVVVDAYLVLVPPSLYCAIQLGLGPVTGSIGSCGASESKYLGSGVSEVTVVVEREMPVVESTTTICYSGVSCE